MKHQPTEDQTNHRHLGEDMFSLHSSMAAVNSRFDGTPGFVSDSNDVLAASRATNQRLRDLPPETLADVFRGYQAASLLHLNRCILDGPHPLATDTSYPEQDASLLRQRAMVLRHEAAVAGLPDEIAELLARVLDARADLLDAVRGD